MNGQEDRSWPADLAITLTSLTKTEGELLSVTDYFHVTTYWWANQMADWLTEWLTVYWNSTDLMD